MADQAGIQQFVYTHKGDNAFAILRDLVWSPISRRFNQSEWLLLQAQSRSGYLSDNKYELDSENTTYIGDRTLDVEFAQNSGLQSINFLESSYEGNQRIQALADVPHIFEDWGKDCVSL